MPIEEAIFVFEHILQESMEYGNFPRSGFVSEHEGRKEMFRQYRRQHAERLLVRQNQSRLALARGTPPAFMPGLRAVALRHDA